MKFPPLEIRVAESLEHALTELAALGSDARILAGGQSLLPLLRYRVARPHVLLDINQVTALRGLEGNADGLRIGALARHSELEQWRAGDMPAGALLRAHARQIAFWPIRTRGTAVGSVVHADPKGDWPLAFFALNADIELRSRRGTRTLPVREFVRGPLDTARAVDEIATAITVAPARARPLQWGRSKLQHRAGEYAMCSAIALRYEAGWECWAGAVGEQPLPLPAVAARLAQAAASRAALLETARAELGALLPELNDVERHRHAVNVVDAIDQATKDTRND